MKSLTKTGWPAVFWIAILCFVPVAMISAVGIANAEQIRPFVQPNYGASNLDLITLMFSGFSEGRSDSWAPMMAALSVAHSTHNHSRLYEYVFFALGRKFQYPPTSLLPMDLLSHMGLAKTVVLNEINSVVFIANAVALAWAAFLLFGAQMKEMTKSQFGRVVPVGIAVIAFVAAFTFAPLVFSKVLGQIQLWIDFLFTLTILCWITNKRFLAGALIGLACLIKPQAAIFLVWAAAWGEWKLVRGMLATAVPLLLVSVMGYGLHNHIEYLRVLSFLSAHGEAFFPNESMNGLMNRLLGNGDNLTWHSHAFPPFNPIVYASTLGFSVFILAIMLLPAWWYHRRANILDLCVATICSVVSSPIAWQHHYGVLAPVFIVVLHAWMSDRAGWRKRLALAGLTLSWTLVATFIPITNLLADTPFNITQSYVFIGALILLGLIFWRRREMAQPITAAHPDPGAVPRPA